jgi:L-fucose mutarotase
MDRVDSDKQKNLIVTIYDDYQRILDSTQKENIKPVYLERFEFYERAKKAYAIIQTGYELILYRIA